MERWRFQQPQAVIQALEILLGPGKAMQTTSGRYSVPKTDGVLAAFSSWLSCVVVPSNRYDHPAPK
jgi:hypothetical protein